MVFLDKSAYLCSSNSCIYQHYIATTWQSVWEPATSSTSLYSWLFDICQVLYFFHIYLKAQQEPAEPDNQKKEQNKIVWTSNDTSLLE